MDNIQKQMVETYQCSGCVCGSDITCFEKDLSLACAKHVAGTMGMPSIGQFFLGMPKGFCRIRNGDTRISIFKDLSYGWVYDKFNVPVWKYLDEHDNTLVRGICPRLDNTWVHIFMGDHIAGINCYEITDQDIEGMD